MQLLLLSEEGHFIFKLNISNFVAASAKISERSIKVPATTVETTKRSAYIQREDLDTLSFLVDEQKKAMCPHEKTLDAKQHLLAMHSQGMTRLGCCIDLL
jgi:transcription initiation factor TFIIIB Brf1 subunit/transcription initiation factor TFIIB